LKKYKNNLFSSFFLLKKILFINLFLIINFYLKMKQGIGDWGLGIGDWG
jgi:hypothetical protein